MTSVLRLVGIIFVFFVALVGWFALGGVMTHRTSTQSSRLQSSVAELWGSTHRQAAPELTFEWKTIEEEVSRETQPRLPLSSRMITRVCAASAQPPKSTTCCEPPSRWTTIASPGFISPLEMWWAMPALSLISGPVDVPPYVVFRPQAADTKPEQSTR